jgi:hypothetical protein
MLARSRVVRVSEWTDPEWLADAHAWIRAHVDPAGEIEQPHVRPWSTVMRVPTADGLVWFKANGPEQQFEAALVDVLAEERPDAVPPLLAVDVERGWMLMADAGERLREIVARERSLACWLDVLPLYAGVQIDLAPRAEELVALGVPDLRLAVLPAKFEAFLDRVGGQLGDDELEARLREKVPWVREACEELASYGIPETIQHDDFHDGQVFVKNGRYLLMDWGDACISHPFFTLSVTLEGVISWGVDDVEGSEDLASYRAAYLGGFVEYGAPADLESTSDLALRLGWVCRAINGDIPGDTDGPNVRLRMFLDGTPD